jgi:hypothetical protein
MFELQNNRGKNLTNMEKLKSYFMYQMYVNSPAEETDTNVENVSNHFKEIYKNVYDLRLDEDSVLIYHCNAYLNASFSYRNLDDITKELSLSDDKIQWINDFSRELATTFALGNESIVADEDYIYVYKEDVVGYEVVAIDKTKSYYSPIRTNINGIATVRLTDNMFYDWNTNKGSEMTESPIIPDTVITIGQQAFYSNNNLKTVNIPSSVEKICVGAFGVCRTLTDVVFGENSRLVEIEEKAFSGCYDLVNIVIPATVEDIGGYAFSHCSVENIILPNVGVLSDDAFSSCHNLTSVTIGNSVTTICKQVFAGCDKLTNINYMGTVAEWNQIVFFGSAESDWNYQVPATYVQCSDGQVPLV